jgi:hypothetical protein
MKAGAGPVPVRTPAPALHATLSNTTTPHPSPLPSIQEEVKVPKLKAHLHHPLDPALCNDFLAYLRTRGKKGHEKTLRARGITKPSVQTRVPNSKQAACRPAQIPRCKYGSHRVLNHLGDDVRNKVCWRHKVRRGENDKDLPCESLAKDL